MTVKYNDPYGNSPYGKLKGDKAEAYFGVLFDEAKIYPTEDGYALAAWCTGFENIQRSFKPENAIDPGLCAIPL